MNWINKRKLFDPTQFVLANGCTEFAQSPQAVVFDEFVRIYFSTRKRDEATGKYLSFIAFIDVDKNLETILKSSTKEVIPLGGLGTFDEHGIFPINLFKEKDRILAYTCGWNRRVSVSVETSIGLAISTDNGETFQKKGKGPILSSSLKEPVLVGDAFVQKYEDVYHMWYIFGKKWMPATKIEPEARVYKIAHATSQDGVSWKKEEGIQIISDILNEDECQALPTVIKIENRYHMYFCFREATDFRKNPERGYKLGYAYSDDLKHWVRDDENSGVNSIKGTWDSDMMCYPHIFQCNSKVYLMYNGNEFGKYGFGIMQLNQSNKEQNVECKIQNANEQQIFSHLKQCDNQFIPALSQRVGLTSYSKKLHANAVTFEAWYNKELVGLLAVYFNDEESSSGFISNVSVLKTHANKGVASKLLNLVKTYAISNNYRQLKLEVNKNNKKAISFYKKHNFEHTSGNQEILEMNYDIKP